MKSDEYTVADERLGIGTGKRMEKEEINEGYGEGLEEGAGPLCLGMIILNHIEI